MAVSPWPLDWELPRTAPQLHLAQPPRHGPDLCAGRHRNDAHGPFLRWTTAVSLIWTLLLTLAGTLLGEGSRRVQSWIEPVATVVRVLLVVSVLAGFGWLGLRIWTKRVDSH